MKSTDLIEQRVAIRQEMMQAFREEDAEKYNAAFEKMCDNIAESVKDEYEQKVGDLREELDSRVLTSRGVRQLTTEEKAYYTDVLAAMRADDPKQALTNVDKALPKTVINAVFDEIRTDHPLLSKIDFISTEGAIEMLMDTSGVVTAAWGKLCAEIVQEITAGFALVDTKLCKLSAFLPVCKAMLELGPEWLDRYVRQLLYEAIANGLEYGIVDGTGNDEPIGMDRQVGPDVTVVAGVYPKKEAITVNDLEPATVGNLISLLAISPNGKNRPVRNVLLLVNWQDYFQKVMPATTVMGTDGTYRNNVLPYPMDVVPTIALDRGEALIGIGKGYFMAVGTAKEGRIEYSDHVHFLEDERVYLIKLYGNGMPKDNNFFQLLDISNLAPKTVKVEVVDSRSPSNDATLSSLKIGALTLTPAFDPDEDEYTATTTNATNVVTAIPAEAAATVKVEVNDVEIDNGTAATWTAGKNTVEVTVTAADGTTTGTYTVEVTKS